ncbi:hypothetical protein JYU34_022904 [Plutella xylostella]|uniref:Uncharacterized protein n=1 Tax=Plutella xylostella TaxID=51655 RepID=A0ABQ7PP16_PLUXY|nr:hypothetical protein JYU34_022904 [Plutella xylostella]
MIMQTEVIYFHWTTTLRKSDKPLVRCRPLHAATAESRGKAKKCAEFLQPYSLEVLSAQKPLVRCRPRHAATAESRGKAKKCAEFLQPYRQRPETCTALARRLVSGALGVKLSTARQERAEERRLITIAREKKRQAALHKEAAWDGSLGQPLGDT